MNITLYSSKSAREIRKDIEKKFAGENLLFFFNIRCLRKACPVGKFASLNESTYSLILHTEEIELWELSLLLDAVDPYRTY